LAISQTSPEQVEVYRFGPIGAFAIVAIAFFLQTFLPVRWHFFAIFDLPLLVTIFFALARRNAITGCLTGCFIGLAQDTLTQYPLGLFGIAKSVVGFGASSLGVKLDVENAVARFLVTFGFSIVHQFLYLLVARGLVGLSTVSWSWGHEALTALANALLAVPLFFLLDRFKQRT
jgi:rod shape-determining protein MreD